jgi:uncharacterized protein
MKIRSITTFIHPEYPLNEAKLEETGSFSAAARERFSDAGIEVQTTRLATVPFPNYLPSLDPDTAIETARRIEAAACVFGWDYVAMGPALVNQPESYALIPDVVAATENIFFSAELTTSGGGVSLAAVRASAEIMHRLAPIDPNGFGNLYFAALANVPARAPFFPAAYHVGETTGFAIAMQAADIVQDAFSEANSLDEAKRNLIDVVEKQAAILQSIAQSLSDAYSVEFHGLDFTPAPHPDDGYSLGAALEMLGVPAIGLNGSLAASAILADALDRAKFKRLGFNGLMLPVLEDATLALRASEGALTINDLLMYSAVCGTGLDTIPLPGDTSPDEMAAILLDLAALAQRLDKPLTARLMPIPGKKAGDPTNFEFDYFANSRVLDVRAAPLTGLFAGEDTFTLQPRKV